MRLHDRLVELAETAPVRPLPAGFATRVHRRRRLRQTMAAVVTLLAVAAPTAYAMEVYPQLAPQPAGGSPALPDRLVSPPWWTADAAVEPIDAAAAAFIGDSVPVRPMLEIDAWNPATGLVALDGDTYRILHHEGRLSPDGRHIIGNNRWIYDLTGQVVRDHNGVAAFSPDSRFYITDDGFIFPWDYPAHNYWRLKVVRDAAGYGQGNFAFSADGSLVAAQWPSGELGIYYRDPANRDETGVDFGSLHWPVITTSSVLAGPGAWTSDGRLAMLTYPDEDCVRLPGSRPLTADDLRRCTARVDLLDPATGRVGPETYPVVGNALGMEVVGWLDGAVYATRHGWSGASRADLIRLDPGATEPVVVMDTPDGTSSLSVATAYLGSFRPAGELSTGFDRATLRSHAVLWALVGFVLVAVLVPPTALVFVLRGRLRRRRAARGAG